jgi:hypothetical protein
MKAIDVINVIEWLMEFDKLNSNQEINIIPFKNGTLNKLLDYLYNERYIIKMDDKILKHPLKYNIKAGACFASEIDVSKNFTSVNATNELVEWHINNNPGLIANKEACKRIISIKEPISSKLSDILKIVEEAFIDKTKEENEILKKRNFQLGVDFQLLKKEYENINLKYDRIIVDIKKKEEKIKKENKIKNKQKNEKLKILETYSEEELAIELRCRGYSGKLEYVREIKV